jgi:hypothetical protein
MDAIQLNATIVNDSSSTMDLVKGNFWGVGFGYNSSESPYQFVITTYIITTPLGSLIEPGPILSLDLAPGQSMEFIFGTLYPNGGSVAYGTYNFGQADLLFDGGPEEYSGDFSVQVVPEPTNNLLLVFGIGCLLSNKLYRSATLSS